MNCTRCHRSVPGNATFCMYCGATLGASVRAKAFWPKALVFGLLALAGAAIAVIGRPGPALQTSPQLAPLGEVMTAESASNDVALLRERSAEPPVGVLEVPQSAGDAGLVQAPPAPPEPGMMSLPPVAVDPGLTQARSEPQPALTRTEAEQPEPGMPPAIRAYLEHVERTERQRSRITQAHLAALMTMLAGFTGGVDVQGLLSGEVDVPDNSQAPNQLAGRANDLRGQWSRLVQGFQSVSPPPECVTLRNQYDLAMRETGAMMGDIVKVVERSGHDPQAALNTLFGMQNQSGHIDQAAKAADAEVQTLCARYGTHKWFSIMADLGGGLTQALGR